MLAVFNTQDEQMHKRIKSPIAPLFSLSNVVQFESLVEEVLECLSQQFDKRFVETGETFDMCEWLQFFAFDVMGTMSFSKRYGFLEEGHDVNGMLDAIFQFMKTAAPVRVLQSPKRSFHYLHLISTDEMLELMNHIFR
jgi:hypothetical protein